MDSARILSLNYSGVEFSKCNRLKHLMKISDNILQKHNGWYVTRPSGTLKN